MDRTNSHDRTLKSILIAGIALSCFYWVCESFMFFFLAPEANFIQHLLGPDMFNTWTRLLVLCLFAIFGSHIQYTITKEREADEALRESEAKYRVILESIEEGVFESDLSGQLTFFNGPFGRILGYPAPELRRMNFADFTTPESEAAAEPILQHIEERRRDGHHPRLHGDRRATARAGSWSSRSRARPTPPAGRPDFGTWRGT